MVRSGLNALWMLVCLGVCPALQAETIGGRVVNVDDGDTLTLLDGANRPHTIQLLGIDAPELRQDFGQHARTSLSALAFNQMARADCRMYGSQGQSICIVHVEGKDVGLEQLRLGMAWRGRQDAQAQRAEERADYEQAEFRAKLQRLGLWRGKNPLPPWTWRGE